MKKLLLISSILFLAASCVPDKDKREERKAGHSAEHMRNRGVDSAALSSEKNVADTVSTREPGK